MAILFDKLVGETHVKEGYKCKRCLIPIDQLHSDKENPRLRNKIAELRHESQIRLTENTIEKKIMQNFELDEIIEGLRQDGEPADDLWGIIKGDAIIIIEGNRRLAACRHLFEEGDERFAKLWVRVYPPDMPDNIISKLIQMRHIKPPLPWPSKDQADYLSDRIAKGETKESLAKRLGKRVTSIDKLLAVRDLMNEYQQETGDFSPDKWTYLHHYCGMCQKVEDGALFVRLKPTFFKLLKQEKFDASNHVYKFGKMMQVTVAKAALLSSGSSRAILELDRLEVPDGDRLSKLLRDTASVVEGLHADEILDVANRTSSSAKNRYKSIVALRDALDEKIDQIIHAQQSNKKADKV